MLKSQLCYEWRLRYESRVICRQEQAASGHILFPVNYCQSSSTDLCKQFVWITLVLADSRLFVLPQDVVSILHLRSIYSPLDTPVTKGKEREKIRKFMQLYNAEVVHTRMQGLVLKVLKLKRSSRHSPQYLTVCCIIALFTDIVEKARAGLKGGEYEWKITEWLNINIIALAIFPYLDYFKGRLGLSYTQLFCKKNLTSLSEQCPCAKTTGE